MTDMIGAPPHYTSNNGSGIECIDITEHLSFSAGNAIKYLWRHESKGNPVADLRKTSGMCSGRPSASTGRSPSMASSQWLRGRPTVCGESTNPHRTAAMRSVSFLPLLVRGRGRGRRCCGRRTQ